MKQCISRITKFVIHLWRTLKEYVRKRVKVRDYTGDGHKDVLITNDPNYFSDCETELIITNKIEENQSQKGETDYD